MKILSVPSPSNDNLFINSFWDNVKQFFQDAWQKVIDYFNTDGTNLLITIFGIILLLLLTLILERITTRLIKRFGRRKDWADEVINGMAFIGRLLILVSGIGLVTTVGGLPDELGITLTAIVGASIGLSATRTIGNIISGFSVLMSRKFTLGDYVKIGNVEGVVIEVTVSHTRLQTSNDRTIIISNQEVANQEIIKYGTDEVERTYTIYPALKPEITTSQIRKIFEKTIKKYSPERVINIKYELIEVTHLARKYEVSFVFDFVEDYFTIPSEFLEDLMDEYDKAVERKKRRKQKK
ncbi:MAG: mechanosensitive ion channel [Asgard group archaeon]|nr:mechanosensitive ion channel [Asgard group archaeon]